MTKANTKTETDALLDDLLKDWDSPADILGEHGLLKSLTKRLVERALAVELTNHLGYAPHARHQAQNGNVRNGTSAKTVETDQGPVELAVPRDRAGTFDPTVVKKRQRRLEGFDDSCQETRTFTKLANRKRYYAALQTGQQSNEISAWMTYFVHMILEAQIQAEEHIEFTLRKTQFFDRFAAQLNERQMRVLRRMLDEGPKGFEGGMNAKKYCSITHTSKATATRDLQDLVEKDMLRATGGGRSTRYEVQL